MATRTIIVHDRCTTSGCGRVLLSINEGERGLCSSCWFKTLSPDTKKALNRVIACVFDGSSSDQQEVAVSDALKKLQKQADVLGETPPC